MNDMTMPPLDDFETVPVQPTPLASYESESALLGGLLLDSRLYDLVGDVLQPKDFADEVHGTVYAAISALAMAGKPVDVITVHDQLESLGKAVQVGGLQFLGKLAQYVPSGSNIRRYAEIIRERALSRQLLGVVNAAREVAADVSTPINERIDQVSAQLSNLLQDAPGEEWTSSDVGMVEFMEELDNRCNNVGQAYLPTGLRDLDEQLDGGMRGGELIIIGARPSMGKTALAMTIGMHCAYLSQTVAMFSLEMQRAALYERQVAMVSEVPLSKLKRPERMHKDDWTAVSRAAERISKLPFYVNDKTNLNINTLRTKARALKRRYGLRLLIVDYLGLMDGTNPRDNRTTQLGEVTRNLKRLAKELGITVLLLAQLNRDVEKRVDQMPIMSDLRDCGEIEQDADIVLFPHRPIHLKPTLGLPWQYYATLRVAKQRSGATGDLNLRYVGHLVKFENWNGDKPGTTGAARQDDDFE